ncbi:MAG: hypothetical protein UW68_C0033G0015 [Candidatus Collierbacteria bacterium GW2011_GWB1_44_6]|uniref:Uncharacterized protein n=1 Tax=Candidatus Collierbacteria bacterium GW2011_GWB1_44_6 TaxID=1618384 RepID=A0A0G1JMF2_9BACT|nr:MAG: hypothetical protein UW68_C0033G0015 [Candidatus Collierbacteria bacterium GW2011_GWB1_44_6]KKT82037.1 MAG: hypothetical protein UW80_C0043G0006 [Microgenomates group bacterium GW2011_GWC1_44_9]
MKRIHVLVLIAFLLGLVLPAFFVPSQAVLAGQGCGGPAEDYWGDCPQGYVCKVGEPTPGNANYPHGVCAPVDPTATPPSDLPPADHEIGSVEKECNLVCQVLEWIKSW